MLTEDDYDIDLLHLKPSKTMLGLSKIAHPNETILLYLHFSKLARLLQKLLIKIEQSNDISSLTFLSRNIDNCYRLKIVKNSLIPVR